MTIVTSERCVRALLRVWLSQQQVLFLFLPKIFLSQSLCVKYSESFSQTKYSFYPKPFAMSILDLAIHSFSSLLTDCWKDRESCWKRNTLVFKDERVDFILLLLLVLKEPSYCTFAIWLLLTNNNFGGVKWYKNKAKGLSCMYFKFSLGIKLYSGIMKSVWFKFEKYDMSKLTIVSTCIDNRTSKYFPFSLIANIKTEIIFYIWQFIMSYAIWYK